MNNLLRREHTSITDLKDLNHCLKERLRILKNRECRCIFNNEMHEFVELGDTIKDLSTMVKTIDERLYILNKKCEQKRAQQKTMKISKQINKLQKQIEKINTGCNSSKKY